MESITERIHSRAFPDASLDVVMVDVFPVSDQERLLLTFETKDSEWNQGVFLSCDRGLEIDGQLITSALLWYETAPRQVQIQCFTSKGLLVVYNIWDRGIGPNSQAYTSGMLVEELDGGRRYRCNDIGFETDFDKLVFRIERIRG